MLHETTKKFMEGFRYDAHPMGMLVSTRGGALHGLSRRRKNVARSRKPAAPDHAPDRQDADHRRVSYRHSLGFPYVYPDNDLSYHRKLHEHAVEDGRAEVRGQPGAGARARHPVHPARRSRAELQRQRHARGGQLAGRPLPVDGGGRGGGAVRPAARRRQRRSAEHAGRDRLQGQCPRLHQAA